LLSKSQKTSAALNANLYKPLASDFDKDSNKNLKKTSQITPRNLKN